MKRGSKLEERFLLLWQALNGPPLEREFRFHPSRRWRSDFAHLASRTLIEIEGGIWTGGRHTRPLGFAADAEKYLEAELAGWRVLRLVPGLLHVPVLTRVVRLLSSCPSPPSNS